MSDEEVIDSRLPYRVGCPTLPVMPVKTLGFQSVTMFGPVPGYRESDIVSVLDQYGIPMREIFLANRVTCGMDTDTAVTNLVILSTYSDGCMYAWAKAVKDIRTGLAQNGLDLSIELIDYNVYYQPLRTSPVPSSDHHLIEGWNKIRLDFLEMLQSYQQDWVSIDVLYRDFPSREKQPTVIISARDADDQSWWDNTIHALKELLQLNGLSVDIVLLYLKDLEFMATSHSTISRGFYKIPVQMGASCATSTSIDSGTLGGRIKICNNSTTFELGLTNYHVMADAFKGSLSAPFHPPSGQPYGAAVSPSNNDHGVFVEALKESLLDVEKRCKKYSRDLKSLKKNDPIWDAMKTAENSELSERETLKAGLDLAEKASRHIGNIYAASGCRTCKNPRIPINKPESRKDWALDWCLIQMDQLKPISIELPNVLQSSRVPDEAVVTQYCSISPIPNYKVIKRGRTSGYTKGTISAIDSTIRSPDGTKDRKVRPQDIPQTVAKARLLGTPQTEEISPTNSRIEFEGKWDGKFVSVFPIISSTKNVPRFMEPGDSGSLILQDRANYPVAPIIGLGFSGNDATLASYMMPIDLVLADIEAVTGSKVIEPLYAGEAKAEED